MISFRDINEENFQQILKLEVAEEDKKFVASNEKSLAECWLYRENNDCFPYGIYFKDELVFRFNLRR